MDLITVREIYRNREQYLNQEVTVGGWVRSIRDSKTFGFLVLHDGTFFETLQVVYCRSAGELCRHLQAERRCSRDRNRNTGSLHRRRSSHLRFRQLP